MRNKKIFITGGAGFIANKLIEKVADENSIVIYDNFARDTFSGSALAHHRNIEVIRGNVLDFDNVLTAMKGAEVVVHAAAIAGIDTVILHPTKTMRVNMIGTANILEAARINGVSDRIIDFSTSEVFGGMAYRVCEDECSVTGAAGEARWSYAVSKLAGEHLAAAYHKEFNLPVVTIRPFNVYGPGQTGEGAILIFIKRALKNEDISIYGDGSRIRAWCYVDDFVDGLLRCIEKPEAIGNAFNIGNPRAVVTVYGLAQTICRVLNSKSKICFKPDLSADIDLRIPSIEKARSLLGFESMIDLEEGILRTADWLNKEQTR
jgi:UDP-glucose 4-epimerase